MRFAAVYTLACSLAAMTWAGLIPYLHGWWRPWAVFLAVCGICGARGGMYAIEVATRPSATFSKNHYHERRAQ